MDRWRQRTDEEVVYLEARNAIEEIVLGALTKQRNGNEAIVLLSRGATQEILSLFGITEPASLTYKEKKS